MGGNEAWLIPLIMGGMGAAQGAMGGGLGDPALLETYSPDPGGFLDPRRMLTQNEIDWGRRLALPGGGHGHGPSTLPPWYLSAPDGGTVCTATLWGKTRCWPYWNASVALWG